MAKRWKTTTRMQALSALLEWHWGIARGPWKGWTE